MILHCYFCQNIIHTTSTVMQGSRLYGVCQICPDFCSTTTQDDHSKLDVATIYFQHGGRDFRADFDLSRQQFMLTEVTVYQQDENRPEDSTVFRPVMSLSFLPDLTPHNIVQKLPTLLVFS